MTPQYVLRQVGAQPPLYVTGISHLAGGQPVPLMSGNLEEARPSATPEEARAFLADRRYEVVRIDEEQTPLVGVKPDDNQ